MAILLFSGSRPNARSRKRKITQFRAPDRAQAAPGAEQLPRVLPLDGRQPGRILVRRLGFLRRHRLAPGRARAGGRRQDARGALVPRGAAQFRREPDAPRRSRRRVRAVGREGFQRRVSFADLYSDVSRAVQALQALGLRAGDRAAAFIPNIPEAGMLALAALSQGIVWSSCSPISASTASSSVSARSSRRCCSAPTATAITARSTTRSSGCAKSSSACRR